MSEAAPTPGPPLATDPGAADPRLRGRTYAIPFERVWRASLAVTGGGLGGWRLLSADENEGVLEAEATSTVLRRRSAVRVDVGLDENGQTRVDLTARALTGKLPHLGRNARFIGAFVRRLDRELGAEPCQILDPRRTPAWIERPAVASGGPDPAARSESSAGP